MPFKSRAQQAYMYFAHPEIAKRWQTETPKDAKLPAHAKNPERHAAPKSGGKKRGR